MSRLSAVIFLSLATVGAGLSQSSAHAQGTASPLDSLALEFEYALSPVDESPATAARNHLVPLGAIQKFRGVWAPEESQRESGELTSRTWRLEVGYQVAEIAAALDAALIALGGDLLYACDAHACGSSSQWANRIFGQRILYGTEKSQRYRAYSLRAGDREYRVVFYASARSSDRQYLYLEQLELITAGY